MAEWKTVTLVLIVLFGLYLTASLVVKPFRLLLKLAFYFVFGAALLVLSNLLLGVFGMKIPVNFVTLVTAGALQVPGLILLVVLSYVFI